MGDFLTVHDLSPEDLHRLLGRCHAWKVGEETRLLLSARAVGLFFEKPSTRTRVAFEVAVAQLGGHPVVLNKGDLQLTRGETVADTARTLARYLTVFVVRTFAHEIVEEWAEAADIPVVNALTDLHHPSQALADLFTIWERRGRLKGVRLAYIGDANNVAHSLIEGAARAGMAMTLACPQGFEPQAEIVEAAITQGRETGAEIRVVRDPQEAARGAEVLYTDVWTSMGQETDDAAEAGRRRKAFRDYRITKELVELATPDALVMHCLPAHRGEEISDEVMDGPQAIVFDQAENRLPMQKAILEWCLGACP